MARSCTNKDTFVVLNRGWDAVYDVNETRCDVYQFVTTGWQCYTEEGAETEEEPQSQLGPSGGGGKQCCDGQRDHWERDTTATSG